LPRIHHHHAAIAKLHASNSNRVDVGFVSLLEALVANAAEFHLLLDLEPQLIGNGAIEDEAGRACIHLKLDGPVAKLRRNAPAHGPIRLGIEAHERNVGAGHRRRQVASARRSLSLSLRGRTTLAPHCDGPPYLWILRIEL